MTIRVLHIFAPGYQKRFGGPVIQWRYHFNKWNDTAVVHNVLDTQTSRIVSSAEVFNFEYADDQKMASRWKRTTWVFSLYKNLIRYRREYDLLHVHVLWWGGLLLGIWGRLINCPVVYESVLLDGDTPSGILKQKLGKLKNLLLKQYTSILAISEHLAEDFKKNGFNQNQVFTLMNSVDTGLFKPAQSRESKTLLKNNIGIPQDKQVLLFVGSVIERKGVDVLINAFTALTKKYPNCQLVIVGPKNKKENPSLDESFVNRLNETLCQEGLDNRCSFYGLIQDREKLSEIYQFSDIFIFPSRNEGLPGVLLEAMASGLPVIVTQLPVLQNIIHHGENGLCIPVNDAVSLKNEIIHLLENPQLAHKLGINARAYVETYHSFQTWQAHLVDYYRGMLAHKRHLN